MARYFEDFTVGEVIKHWPGRTIRDFDDTWFTLMTMNTNPLHFDENFPMLKPMGLNENIVHGRFKYAQVGRLVFAFAGYKGRVKKFGVSYRGMDMLNKQITAGGVVTAKRQEGGENLVDLDIWTEDADGKKTTPGTAVVALPSKG